MSFPKVIGKPADAFNEVLPGVFCAEGHFNVGPGICVLRTMTVVKEGSELAIINSVRLNEEGLKALDALGTVKHVVKQTPGHGADDAFYMNRYPSAKLWAHKDANWVGAGHPNLKATDDLSQSAPFGMQVYSLKGLDAHKMKEFKEVVLLHNKVLITGDCIQNYVQESGDIKVSPGCNANFGGRKMTPMLGFKGRAAIVNMYLKLFSPDGKWESLKADFEHILTMDFDALVPCHGFVIPKGAKADLKKSVDARNAAPAGGGACTVC